MLPKKETESPRRLLVQVDLDGLWAIKAVYGLAATRADLETDPMYDLGLPRLLELFARREIRATFFAVGRDCEIPAKRDLLRQAAEAGHEIANHTQSHLIGLGALAPARIADEISQGADAIDRAIGVRPIGFRSPGFDSSPEVLRQAARAGAFYDSSLLPTRVGPLLRAASRFFRKGKTAAAQRNQYGSGPVWKAPREPYHADLDAPWRPAPPNSTNKILEIPPAVTARLRLPVHAGAAMAGGWTATRLMLDRLARQTNTLVYVLHPIDTIGGEEVRGLPTGPLGRRVFLQPRRRKEVYIERALDLLLENHHSRLSREFARSA